MIGEALEITIVVSVLLGHFDLANSVSKEIGSNSPETPAYKTSQNIQRQLIFEKHFRLTCCLARHAGGLEMKAPFLAIIFSLDPVNAL